MTVVDDFTSDRRVPFIRPSETTEDQQETELECEPFLVDLGSLQSSMKKHLQEVGLLSSEETAVLLLRQKHVLYLSRAFGELRYSFVSLDASRPWMLYWTLHSCDLMDMLPPDDTLCGIVSTLEACWQATTVSLARDDNDPFLKSTSIEHESGFVQATAGGFGGGPGQMAHCATTYAAVLCLCIVATHNDATRAKGMAMDLLKRIRFPLYAFFKSLQQGDRGGFRMHHDGEMDVRASYTVVCCAKLLGIYNPNTLGQTQKFIRDCQTYEGGFGGEPFSEAHGGYAFCAVAALQLMNCLDVVDIPALRGWLLRRQMAYEGGFCGRCNKLVDGCYSFWQGGALAILSAWYDKQSSSQDPWLQQSTPNFLLFDEPMLQRYILLCAQDINGGLRDKPSKPRDFYHSCYNLSGLSVSQHYSDTPSYGHATCKLAKTHPCYNIRVERVSKLLAKFSS